jgi:NAD-dependent deacetylase
VAHEAADHEALADVLAGAGRVVMLTGLALGVIEDRELTGAAGQWAQRASLEAFLTEPARFWEFYYPAAQLIAARTPGPGHAAIARMQNAGMIHGLVTQAVDRLHLKAGSPDLVEVHGHVMTTRCERCREIYGLPEVKALIDAATDGVPRCTNTSCRYPLRPSTSLWGEPLIEDAVTRAWDLAADADAFVVVDSSLRTIPMSLLPSVPLTRQVPLVLITPEPTQYDRYAQVVVRTTESQELLVAVADLLESGAGAVDDELL